MDNFTTLLLTFNPFWLGGAILVGYFLGRIFNRGFLVFAALTYPALVISTVQADKLLLHSRVGSEYLRMAGQWSMGSFEAASLLVALFSVMIVGIFWAVSR